MSDDAQTALVLAQLAVSALSTVLAVLRWRTGDRTAGGGEIPHAGSRPFRWCVDLFVGGAVVVIAFVAFDVGVAPPLVVGLGALTLALALVPVAVHARDDRT